MFPTTPVLSVGGKIFAAVKIPETFASPITSSLVVGRVDPIPKEFVPGLNTIESLDTEILEIVPDIIGDNTG